MCMALYLLSVPRREINRSRVALTKKTPAIVAGEKRLTCIEIEHQPIVIEFIQVTPTIE